MAIYFLSGVLITLVLCGGIRWWIQRLLAQEKLMLDDAKGYFLITCIVVGFLVSAGFFWAGLPDWLRSEPKRSAAPLFQAWHGYKHGSCARFSELHRY